MKVTITLEHWNKAKEEDKRLGGTGRIRYCPIAQALLSMGWPNVKVTLDYLPTGYSARYGTTSGQVTGCAVEVARTFDIEKELPDGLLPCEFELPDAN